MSGHSPEEDVKARVLCVISASPQRIESRIVHAVADAIGDERNVEIVRLYRKPLSILPRLWRAARNCDILIVHSPFLLSIGAIVIGRLLRRKIIGLLWDDYPVFISGRRYDNSIRRRLFDWIENWGIDHIKLLLVPSPDFRSVEKYQDTVFCPFWCRSPSTISLPQPERVKGAQICILFAGQVNRTRGLENALALLSKITDGDFVLRIAAPDCPGATILEHPNVQYLGHLTQGELALEAQKYDAGLISLHPDFDGVGFPSKTFDYLSWNLPLLFAGRTYPWMTGLAEQIGIGIDGNTISKLYLSDLTDLRTDFAGKRKCFERRTCLDVDALKSVLEKS